MYHWWFKKWRGKRKKKCLNKHNDFENPIPKETGNDGKIQITENSSDLELKKSCNPYEYPDDFQYRSYITNNWIFKLF